MFARDQLTEDRRWALCFTSNRAPSQDRPGNYFARFIRGFWWVEEIATLIQGTVFAGYSFSSPVVGIVKESRRITAEDHFQDTRHIAFDLGDRGPKYEPGDILSIWAQQDNFAIQKVLDYFGLDGQSLLEIELTASSADGGPKSVMQVG